MRSLNECEKKNCQHRRERRWHWWCQLGISAKRYSMLSALPSIIGYFCHFLSFSHLWPEKRDKNRVTELKIVSRYFVVVFSCWIFSIFRLVSLLLQLDFALAFSSLSLEQREKRKAKKMKPNVAHTKIHTRQCHRFTPNHRTVINICVLTKNFLPPENWLQKLFRVKR